MKASLGKRHVIPKNSMLLSYEDGLVLQHRWRWQQFLTFDQLPHERWETGAYRLASELDVWEKTGVGNICTGKPSDYHQRRWANGRQPERV